MTTPDRPTELRERRPEYLEKLIEEIEREGKDLRDKVVLIMGKENGFTPADIYVDTMLDLIESRSRTDQRKLLERLNRKVQLHIEITPDIGGGQFFNDGISEMGKEIDAELARLEGEGK